MSHTRAETKPGTIEVICGCMFSGKTARLIERLCTAAAAGRRVLAFKHKLDQRYTGEELATHDERRFPAASVADAGTIAAQATDAEVVGIDEVQFFGSSLIEVCETLRARGCRVIVAGIDYNAWGRPFSPLPQLKDVANAVEVLHAACRVCGGPARYSQRLSPIVDGQMVGGPEAYEPRCASCFVPLDSPASAE